MKAEWQTSTLGELLAVLRNGINCKQDKSGAGDRISRIESISDARFDVRKVGYANLSESDKHRYLLKSGDILLSHINSPSHVGKTALFDSSEPFYHGVNLLLMRPKDVVTSAYLDYALKHLFQSGYWLGVCKQSVNQASVNQQDISRVPIQYPKSIPEQQRIVGLLDEAFDGIATAKANAERNLKNARALFESHLQSVFSRRGEGWAEKTIGEVCILRSGTTLPKEIEKPSGETPYLKVADMNINENLNGVTCSSRYVNKSDVNASNLLPVGTTIFPKRGGAILTNKKRLTECVICADLNIMGVTPKSGLLPKFLFNFFLQLDLREISNGSSIPQINNYSIEPLLIAFPKSTAEQQAIVTKLTSLSEETQRLESIYQQKLAALEALKKSLLHQAFAGEL